MKIADCIEMKTDKNSFKDSKTKNAKTKSKSKTKKRVLPKVSPYMCPQDMSLEAWQCALRRQAAEVEAETLKVAQRDDERRVFKVMNLKHNTLHEVEYYGLNSRFNRCDCLDFRTAMLGTCKHLEAVARSKYKSFTEPKINKLFIDYNEGRKLMLLARGQNSAEIKVLASNSDFDEKGHFNGDVDILMPFIKAVKKLDSDFEVTDEALDLIIQLRQQHRRLETFEQKYRNASLDGLLSTTLYPYQIEGIKFGFKNGRVLIADEMGLGKTIQAIGIARLLLNEGLINSVLVVCPTSLKYQWKTEIARFAGMNALMIEGSAIVRRQLFQTDDVFKICSYHTLTNDLKGGAPIKPDLIIYDEVQRLKNWDTKMAKAARNLHSEYVVALSGTPLENKITELYAVMELVDQYCLAPYYRFIDTTVVRSESGQVVGYKNLNIIGNILHDVLLRRRKRDVQLQMPSRTDKVLYVPMTPEQMAVHEDNKATVAKLISKWRKTSFLSEKDRKRLLLCLSIMRMVCDSTYIIDQSDRHDTKIAEALSIVQDIISSSDEKVVIFSQWERMLRLLSSELTQASIKYEFLHGGVPSKKRPKLISNFKEDADCRVFISTDAGSTGLNLQNASYVINLDLPWNPAVLEQRIGRVYRLGQELPVHVINMVAAETIEERMLSTLNFKAGLAEGILDSGEDAIFLEQSKFNSLMESLDQTLDDVDTTTATEAGIIESDESENVESGDETDAERLLQEYYEDQPQLPNTDTDKNTENYKPHKDHKPSAGRQQNHDDDEKAKARNVVAQGVSFISQLADMLAAPGGAEKLADSLVEEDYETGQASLKIPVPDKSTVVNLLSSLGKLFANK